MEYSFEKCNIPNRLRRREYAIFIDAERTHSPRGRQLAIFPVMHLPYSLLPQFAIFTAPNDAALLSDHPLAAWNLRNQPGSDCAADE